MCVCVCVGGRKEVLKLQMLHLTFLKTNHTAMWFPSNKNNTIFCMSLSTPCQPAYTQQALHPALISPKFNQNHTRTKLYKQASQLAKHIAWMVSVIKWMLRVYRRLIGTGSKGASASQRFGKIRIKRLEEARNCPGAHSDIRGQFSLFVPLFVL